MPKQRYDINNLQDDEINILLDALKKPKRIISFNKMYSDISTALFLGPMDEDQEIVDNENGIKYIFHIRRSRFEERYSIHLRFKRNSMHLLRLDIGTGHENPDGTRINEDHIHIYVSSQKHAKYYGTALKLSDFPNVHTFVEALDSFLLYTNINH